MAIAILLALTVVATPSAQAQTFNVIYNFTGGLDGWGPFAGLIMDQAGNLYGTTYGGGNYGGNCGELGCGAVFKLAHKGSGWILTPLYDFAGGNDGLLPTSRVIIGPDGSLYGTAQGGAYDRGVVWEITP